MGNSFLTKGFEALKNGIWDFTHKDPAKMLIGMGALGFALSSMAQCFAIKINDKIDKKKKKFLLAQEVADGAVNIGLFLGLTSSIWKISDKLLKMTGIAKIGKGSQATIINPEGRSHIKSGGRILTTTIASVVACNIITPIIRNFIAGKLTARRDKQEKDSQTIVNEVIIKNQLLSPFKSFDNFALKGANNMTFRGKKNLENPLLKQNYTINHPNMMPFK